MRVLYTALTFFVLFLSCSPLSSWAATGWVSSTNAKIIKRQTLIESILIYYRPIFAISSLLVFIDENMVEPRGKMKGSNITLSEKVVRDGEFIKLFVHELGHYIDIYVLVNIAGEDVSHYFYEVSWENSTVKKSGEGISSFVSGYALTNQYEDFAESFTFYIFHNEDFAERALKNESLRKKYLFFSKYAFKSWQFSGTDFSLARVPKYLWDTTKIPISLQKYLYSLK